MEKPRWRRRTRSKRSGGAYTGCNCASWHKVTHFISIIYRSAIYQLFRGLVSRFPLISGLLSTAGFLILLLIMLSGCILPNVLHRHHESELDTASQAHEQNEDEQSNGSATDSEDKSSLRTRRAQRPQRSQTSGEHAVRLDSII
jgi:hypothetical protein